MILLGIYSGWVLAISLTVKRGHHFSHSAVLIKKVDRAPRHSDNE